MDFGSLPFPHHVITIYTRNMSMEVYREEGGRYMKPHDHKEGKRKNKQGRGEVCENGKRERLER